MEAAGADWIHVDVMDGRFVPNITIGPLIVRAVRAATSLPIDVHLMIVEPERYVEEFRKAGATSISIHVEASAHVHRALQQIRASGALSGIVLNPHSSEELIRHVIGEIDVVLAMTVNPGFGGQSFISSVLPKIRSLREMIDRSGREIALEVDGGVTPETVGEVVNAGGEVMVAGTAVFGRIKPEESAEISFKERVDRYAEAIDKLRQHGRMGAREPR